MKKKSVLLILALPFLLTGCGDQGDSKGSGSSVSGSNDSGSSTSDTSSSLYPADEDLSAKGIYRRLTRISTSSNYTFESVSDRGASEYEDVYNESYIIKNADLMGYVLLSNTVEGGKGVYTVPLDRTDESGKRVLSLGTAYAKRDPYSGAAIGIESDLRSFDYLRLFDEYKGQGSLIPQSAIRKKKGRDDVYVSNNEYLLAILGRLTGYSNYISVTYEQVDFFFDEENNLGFYLYSKNDDDSGFDEANPALYEKEETTATDFPIPSSFESALHYCTGGILKNIGTSSDADFDKFLTEDLDCTISQTPLSTNAEALIVNEEGYSCDTSFGFEYYKGLEEYRDFGTVSFDYTDSRMRRSAQNEKGKSVEIIAKDDMDYAYQEYLGGSNEIEKIPTDTPYQYFYSPDSGWDLNGFRKVEGKDYYLYYGYDHFNLFKGLTQGSISSSDFGIQRIEARVNDKGEINEFTFVSTLGYYQVDSFTSLFGRFVYHTTVLETPRVIGSPTPLSATSDTPAIEAMVNKTTDGNTAIKTVAQEAYQSVVGTIPTVTSYYDKDVVYHERLANGKKTGYGYYKTAAGLVNFVASYDEDGVLVVEPKSAPREDTVLNHWVPMETSPLALEYDDEGTGLVAREDIYFLSYSAPYVGHDYYGASSINPEQMGNARYVLSTDKTSIASFTYDFAYSNDVFGIYDAGSGKVDFYYDEEAALPNDLLTKLAAMPFFDEPTSWSECTSKNKAAIVKMFETYFKDTGITLEDIPYFYDPILDDGWAAYTGNGFASVWIGGWNGDGDVNGIFTNWKATLTAAGFEHFVYEDYVHRKFDAYKKDGLYVVVNNDLNQGIYFYKTNPMGENQ